MMPIHGGFWILEAAFRSLLMALAVWAGIRMLRVQAVLAQKIAWVLVLLAAGTMPLVMRAPWLALDQALRIPLHSLPGSSTPTTQPAAVQASSVSLSPDVISTKHFDRTPKPTPLHSRANSSIHSSKPLQPMELKPDLQSGAASAVPSLNQVSIYKNEASFWSWARIKLMLAILYLAVGSVLLLRTLAGLGIAFRIWRRSKPVAAFANGTILAAETQATQARSIRISPDLATPVTIGSTVILPADYAEWDAAKLRIVLAHEQSHVRQGDFYLQLLAAIHVAVFWFSPLGWWLQRKLSELGEALSDRAGLEQASNPVSYAQVLLEFAAKPRTTPLAGVAMARNSNLSSRIERILNARRFRLAFLGGRRHAFLAAILVPAALVAAVGLIRIVPAVEAAQTSKIAPISKQGTGASTPASPVKVVPTAYVAPVVPPKFTTPEFAQSTAPSAPVVAPAAPDVAVPEVAAPAVPAPAAPTPAVKAPQAPETPEVEAPAPPRAPGHKHGSHIWIDSDDDDAYAIVQENSDKTIRMNGMYNGEFQKVRRNHHGNYIWFEHDGKSYIIDDPAILTQAQQLFKGNEELERQMAELEKKQQVWEKRMADLEPEMAQAKMPGPEFAEKMAKLNAELAELQTEKFKKMTDQINKEFSQEKLAELQEKMGEIQGQLGEIQGEIGERQGKVGEKQGAIGEQMGVLGEQMGKIGEQQGKIAEEASRKLKSVFDQAIKDGKAKPVE
jgi:beta-lactamase regulating signal transducer with metallopeptidase domain